MWGTILEAVINNLTILVDNAGDTNCDNGESARIDYVKVDVTSNPNTVPPKYSQYSINNTTPGEITQFGIM